MAHATAAIIAIGDELTLGQLLDTNSRWLSERLVELGIEPIEHVTVPDDQAAIEVAMRRMAELADVVISTGGLGPTEDDLTRAALADVLGEEMVRDEAAAAAIRAWFAGRGRPMVERNLLQALRPASAECLGNASGTAPGLHARIAGKVDVFCLPGPPAEMKAMFEAQVMPRLHPPPGRIVVTRALHCFGLGESEVAERLGALMERGRNPVVGTTVSMGVVTCRVRYEGVISAEERRAGRLPPKIAETETAIRERLGAYIFGEGSDTLASVVIGLLKGRDQTIATVESCTGGLLGAALTDIPGSSAAYLGGWVTYANELKIQEVDVPAELMAPGGPGAVSRETAEAMARGGLERSGAAHCVSITGIAGPDGGTAEKPVGTVWIAVASLGGAPAARRFQIPGAREAVRAWSVYSALAMLRLRLVGERGMRLLRQVE